MRSDDGLVRIDQNTFINNSEEELSAYMRERHKLKEMKNMSNRITQLETKVTKIMTLLEELNARIK